MTAPVVAIELAAENVPRGTIDALLDACTGALSQGTCVAASSVDPAQPVAATVLVSWEDGDRQRVRIELGKPGADRDAWLRREIVFRPEDAERERWRATGLVIATLAGDAGVDPGRPPTPPAAPPVAPSRREAPSRPPHRGAASARHRTWVWLDVAAAVSPALDDGSWRAGASLRAGVPVWSTPLFGLAALRYAVRPLDDAGLAVQFASGSLGGGLYLTPAPALSLQARVEILAELIAASARDPETDASDSGSRWIGGARVGIDGAWMLSPGVGLLAGVDVTLLQSATDIRMAGRAAATVPAASFAPALGIRLGLP
ncbi:MAG: hypothetical protein WKG00_18145 [Polyangiaceae bacterium]